ncbi:MAG: alpha/beta hydrolase [Spirochaetota bacterium]
MNEKSRKLYESELARYNRDHAEFFIASESKSKETGRPLLLETPGSQYGVLLMHGYLAQPEEVKLLAEYLHGKGYSVFVPRFPGHGTTPDDLLIRSWEEWYATSRTGYEIIRGCADKIISMGFSMGGAMALLNAERNKGDFCAVVSISAPIKSRSWALRNIELIYVLQRITRAVGIKVIPLLLNHHPDNPEINYLRNPVRGVAQVDRAMKAAIRGLKKIDIPILVGMADEDPVSRVEGLDLVIKKVRSAVKESFSVKCKIHGIVRGDLSREVFERVDRFLEKVKALTA